MTQRSQTQMPTPVTLVSSGGRLVAHDGRTLALDRAILHTDANGGLARVVLEQHFRNAYPEPLHVTYLLPLPVDGAVSGFTFRIGDRRVVGEVDGRAAARERFEDALLEGRTAALLEQDRGSLFTQELGNLPPGTDVLVEVTIDQRLRWLDEGAWEWRFPTVVAPRYLGGEGRVPDASRVTVDVADSPVPVRMELRLAIRDPAVDETSPVSPSHAIRAGRRDDGLEVTLASGAAALDRDVVVRWAAARPTVGVGLETGRPSAVRPGAEGAYGLLTLVPPAPTSAATAFPRDLIVLLDTSGSMSGAPLAQARRVIAALVESLHAGDRLELIAFADRAWRWRSGAAAATPAARAAALRWLEDLEAGGGTEMGEGIAAALRPLRPESQRQVVLVTDGLIGYEAELAAAILRDLPPASRLHTVGVGPAVNRDLTAGTARAGRGAEVLVGLDDDPAEAARRLVARTRAPLLTDLTLDGSALLGHAPARLPDLLASGPALIAVKLRPEGGELRLGGRAPGGGWATTVTVPAVAAGAGRLALATLYGREAVEDLECRRVAGEPGVDARIERLGVAFQIATRLTSWVAVSETPSVDPTQPARRERIPHALPAGLSAEGLGLRRTSGMVVADVTPLYSTLQSMVSRKLVLSDEEVHRARVELFQPSSTRPTVRELRHVPEPPTPLALTGRILKWRDRQLVIEISLDRSIDWRPTLMAVRWSDGTQMAAGMDIRRSTRAGRIQANRVIRLVLQLAVDGPTEAPTEVVVAGEGASVRVDLRGA